MKKLVFTYLLACLVITAFVSCTDNERVKAFGGTAEYILEPDQKLVNVTWKENQVWYLTRPMHSDESAETYTFQEKSSYGIMEGTYIIKEQKTIVQAAMANIIGGDSSWISTRLYYTKHPDTATKSVLVDVDPEVVTKFYESLEHNQ